MVDIDDIIDNIFYDVIQGIKSPDWVLTLRFCILWVHDQARLNCIDGGKTWNKSVLFVLYFVTHTHTGIIVRAVPPNLNVFPGHSIEFYCYCTPGLVTHNMIHRPHTQFKLPWILPALSPLYVHCMHDSVWLDIFIRDLEHLHICGNLR